MQLNNNTLDRESQVKKILLKAQIKKSFNKKIVDYFESVGNFDRANRIRECGTYLGITFEEDFPKIVKANFCRDRLCYLCAWRRQSKFIAQMSPVLNILSKEFEFLFLTLTMRNVSAEELPKAVTTLLNGFNKFMKRRKISHSFEGVCRSLEITYNNLDNTYHPHLHLLVAVRPYYFTDSACYISQIYLSGIWSQCVGQSSAIVDIRKVDDVSGAEVETLKYAFKPPCHVESFGVLSSALKGRRLVSFTGVFSTLRRELRLSSFEDNLLDDMSHKDYKKKYFNLYKFDVTGGVYTFYNTYELEG